MACTLNDDDARTQLTEWRTIVARAITQRIRTSPTRLALELEPQLSDATELIRLAQREKTCCRFFNFTIIIDELHVRLVIDVPEEAIDVLDDFETHLR